jgi:prevent-host-death family protein
VEAATRKKKVVTIHEAKTHLSRFVARAAAGEEIVIARGDRPMARLVPLLPTQKDRVPGSARGEIWISEDFAHPLPEDDLGAFSGHDAGRLPSLRPEDEAPRRSARLGL